MLSFVSMLFFLQQKYTHMPRCEIRLPLLWKLQSGLCWGLFKVKVPFLPFSHNRKSSVNAEPCADSYRVRKRKVFKTSKWLWVPFLQSSCFLWKINRNNSFPQGIPTYKTWTCGQGVWCIRLKIGYLNVTRERTKHSFWTGDTEINWVRHFWAANSRRCTKGNW